MANRTSTAPETKAPETKAPETKAPETKAQQKTVQTGAFKGQPLVSIRLPLSRSEKDDKFVSVNGKTMLIKRGEDVEVPQCVFEVLQHQENMLRESLEFESAVSKKAGDEELN